MRRILDKLYEIIPAYSLFPLVFSFTFNMFVYVGSRMIAGEWHHYNIESSLDRLIPFWPAGRRDLSGLLLVLGGELHFDCKAGPGGGLQVLFRRFSFPYCLSVIFFVDSDDKYQTDGRGGWFLESGDDAGVFHRCSGQSLSFYSLPGQLVLLYRDTREERISGVVSGLFSGHGSFDLYFYSIDKTACACGRCGRRPAGRNMFLGGEETHGVWCV